MNIEGNAMLTKYESGKEFKTSIITSTELSSTLPSQQNIDCHIGDKECDEVYAKNRKENSYNKNLDYYKRKGDFKKRSNDKINSVDKNSQVEARPQKYNKSFQNVYSRKCDFSKSAYKGKRKREEFDRQFKKKKNEAELFRYGNFHYYYGYRNQGVEDSRLACMKKEWFAGKDVLDIGCNAGHLTLSIARDFSPRCIIGIDIDNTLIQTAEKNIRNYLLYDQILDSDFPLSCVICYGPFPQAIVPGKSKAEKNFPHNIGFVQANYILESDDLVKLQEPCFDTILCLSLTKWIHLNWGDTGIKRLFHRIYNHLRPGGFLILETQPFKTYSKKKKIDNITLQNYNSIKLFPEQFNDYLLNEVGFKKCKLIDIPAHSSEGFRRPVYLFTKD